MSLGITILIIVVIIEMLFTYFSSYSFKLFLLRIKVQTECETKVKFSYETKLGGTVLYIFTDENYAYTIDEFGNICGKRRLYDDEE